MAKLIKLVNKEYARLLDRMYKDIAYTIVQQDANGIVLKAPDYFAEFMARSSGTNKIFLDSEYSFSKATQSSVADILYNFSRVVSITSSGNNATAYVDIANLKTVSRLNGCRGSPPLKVMPSIKGLSRASKSSFSAASSKGKPSFSFQVIGF